MTRREVWDICHILDTYKRVLLEDHRNASEKRGIRIEYRSLVQTLGETYGHYKLAEDHALWLDMWEETDGRIP